MEKIRKGEVKPSYPVFQWSTCNDCDGIPVELFPFSARALESIWSWRIESRFGSEEDVRKVNEVDINIWQGKNHVFDKDKISYKISWRVSWLFFCLSVSYWIQCKYAGSWSQELLL